ncbi:MAG: (2Fe-2S)-binding protein [Actinomycetota bacterium]|nr:(2Fe-2S)-binding protein [Actinomycetota bacterium]
MNDRRIREAIQRGAHDEFAVAEACGAGTGCGGCAPAIKRLLGECVGCPVAANGQRQATASLGRYRFAT